MSSNMRTPSTIRWKLLSTASVFALLASTFVSRADANDGDRPTLWIELGGQLEGMNAPQEGFSPSFFNAITNDGFTSPLKASASPRYGTGLEAAISFLPDGAAWGVSGSIRYGRSGNSKFLHQQLPAQITHYKEVYSKYRTARPEYAETRGHNSEKHLIADFQAERDVGLGMLGKDSTSTVGFGVRYAQFTSGSDLAVRARPDVHFISKSFHYYSVDLSYRRSAFNQYLASARRSSDFHAVGPSISWNASLPVIGNSQDNAVAVDWGLNAAVLFGRQRAKVQHQSSGTYYNAGKYLITAKLQPHSNHSTRSRSVVVPNVGGFAGLSFRYADAKVSFGYRADFFFGAMDNGLDSRKSEARGFYGPFASISVGLGD